MYSSAATVTSRRAPPTPLRPASGGRASGRGRHSPRPATGRAGSGSGRPPSRRGRRSGSRATRGQAAMSRPCGRVNGPQNGVRREDERTRLDRSRDDRVDEVGRSIVPAPSFGVVAAELGDDAGQDLAIAAEDPDIIAASSPAREPHRLARRRNAVATGAALAATRGCGLAGSGASGRSTQGRPARRAAPRPQRLPPRRRRRPRARRHRPPRPSRPRSGRRRPPGRGARGSGARAAAATRCCSAWLLAVTGRDVDPVDLRQPVAGRRLDQVTVALAAARALRNACWAVSLAVRTARGSALAAVMFSARPTWSS